MKRLALLAVLLAVAAPAARAQEHDAHTTPAWHFMQDAVVWVMFNDQGSPRGRTDLKAPNWWMGMFERRVGRGTLTLDTMLSFDPATVGAQGYSHIFQVGETYQGNALIDHQHPHDFLRYQIREHKTGDSPAVAPRR